ncbi:AbrB family transcriptional regulator [Priestia endophytica]|jgi:uncharacterized protein|uniref:AbrB family transcriptional regulator n=1 Tax=Priestia endophytica TaxID=135735 RepID=UPI000F54635A|nr:AbrB family transcriptional regulator [Priestia endophytica]RPK12613.1 hypothetical protein FH5_02819 [Priestia endophytica]
MSFYSSPIRLLITLILAVVGGTIFSFFHIPLSWMLGSLTATLVFSRVSSFPLLWPVQLRNVGLLLIGYMLGRSFTKETLLRMIHHLPSMLLLTILILVFSSILAYYVSKVTNINLKSTLTGSIPGGLSQMIVLGEELKGIDLTVVTFIQATRLMAVVFTVPFLASFFSNQERTPMKSILTAFSLHDLFIYIGLLLIGLLCAIAGKYFKLPTRFLLGPILITGIFVIAGGTAPHPPDFITDGAQLLMGTYLGLILKPNKLTHKARFSFFAILTAFSLILFSFLSGMLLFLFYDIPITTAFLSVAPGGMAEMAVVAEEVKASLAVVTSFQLFRILFILFLMPPFLRWLFKQAFFKRLEQRTDKQRT